MERAAYLVARPENQCHRCDDDSRDARNCPKPRRDGGEPNITGAPACPVLDLPGWFWGICDESARRQRGHSRPLEYHTVLLLDTYDATLALAHEDLAESRRKDDAHAAMLGRFGSLGMRGG